jgi:hypothetical protein
MEIVISRHRMYRGAGVAGTLGLTIALLASPAYAEQDHLEGYIVQDANRVLAPNPVAVQNAFGDDSCVLRKVRFYLAGSEKNGGDDPRGGPTADFVCYKARCSSPPPATIDADTQFGGHQIQFRRAKLVCLPFDTLTCGDGDLDPSETCDGVDDATCPGECQPDCTCPPPPACEPDGSQIACRAVQNMTGGTGACSACCNGEPACSAACLLAATSACLIPADNDACGAAVNAAGCADLCCP